MKTTKVLSLIAFLLCFTATIKAAEQSIPDNEIHYTSSDGNVVGPNITTDGFGAHIISHTYENGVGIITFGGPVTKIGDYTFRYCEYLTSITIPNSVTSIGKHAFYGCESLTSVIIGNSVMSIGNNAFFGCISLLSITIPNSVISIEDWAFSECNSLTSITIPNSVTSIGDYAFRFCGSLTYITIPNSVKNIGDGAFWYCYSLTSITIPNSVISLGALAFGNCTSLTTIAIPDSITYIENKTFENCTSLTSVTIPSSVTDVGSDVFNNCYNLDTIYCNAMTPPSVFREWSFANYDAVLYVPCEALDAYKADAIWGKFSDIQCIEEKDNNKIFYTTSNGDVITFAYLPDAFGANLISNTYENGVGTITFDAPVTKIGDDAFHSYGGEDENLTSITIPNSVTSIGKLAFCNCSFLTSIIIPNNVTSIEASAFADCSSLTSISIGDNVLSIGDGAFANCSSLVSVTIPNTVTSIGNTAFNNCLSLTSISIGNHVSSIGDYAFGYCYSLTSITIPSSVTSIGYRAIDMCQSLSSIVVEHDNKVYDSRNNCNALIHTSTNTLIVGCANTVIPNNVTHIGDFAFFYLPALTSITIPKSITTIGQHAFSHNFNLRTIYCYATTPPALNKENTFYNYDFKATLYVPCEALDAYKTDSTWGKFNNIQCIASPSDPCEDIVELDWRVGIRLSVLTAGWYKLYVGDIHANQADFTYTIINDLACPATMNRAYYANCEDSEAIIEGSVRYELGETIQTMSYADFADIVAPHVDYLYLNIKNIVENCPVIDPCEHVTELDLHNGIRLSQLSTGWYKLYVGEIHANQSDISYPFINDMACPVIMSIAYYFHCNDTEDDAMMEMTRRWALGETTQTMSYADFVDIVAPQIDYLYLNIASIVEDCQKDTIIENITDWVCDGGTYEDILGEEHVISSLSTDTHTWSNTIETDTTITIYNYTITPIVPPTIMTNELLATIPGATPVLIAGKKVDVTGTLEAIKNYYNMNDTEAVADVESIVWATGADVTLACDAESHTMILELFAGCDFVSLTELVFEVDPIAVTTTTETAIICEGETYQWQGISCSETGNYSFEVTNEVGCVVEIKVLELTVIPAEIVTTADTATICEGDSYVWAVNGITYENLTAGVYSYKDTTMYDCSIVINTLQLIVEDCAPPCEDITTEEYATICYGETYTWNGYTYSTEGEYSIVLMNALGCDSIATLHLTVLPEAAVYSTTAIICEGETYIWRGMELSQGGSYTDVEQDPTTGCDIAIYTLLLTIENCAPPCEDVATEEYATICYGETYTWNGQSYSTTGEYTQTLSSVAGCDSIVTLYLTVLSETIIVEENVTINEEYLPYTWRNQQCYSAGTYNESIPFANYPYCDSVIYVLNLTVEAPNKCGDHLYWHYSNNTMTITGSGAMYDDPDLLSYRQQPWYPERVSHVILPNAITHIGNVAFADCANLTHIDIPNSVTSLGDGAFSWTGLQYVTIPIGVTTIGEQVFETCNNLRTILYEGNPTTINNKTVHPLIGCVHLDTIITPAALWHCTTADPALETRYGVPNKARYIEITNGELTKQAMTYIAKNRGTMQVLDLSAATNTTLPLGALMNSYRLSNLYLPEQIRTIPEMLAEGCHNLTEIIIPATVKEIGNYAFAGCTNVWQMTVDAVVPPTVYAETFKDIDRNISVIVPAGSEEAYRQAAYWQEFFIKDTNSPSPITNCQKILHEDQILILRNGNIYTTMGQLVEKK